MLAGIDEAGRGPVFGPMVVAGVAVEDDAALRGLGVRDSKKLSPAAREVLAPRIKGLARWHVRVLHAAEINAAMRRRSLNAIEVEAFAEVARKLGPGTLFLDAADVVEERFGRLVAARAGLQPRDVVAKHHGDDLFPVVSAASILAKVTRDREVRHLARVLETELPMPLGSGYPADPETIAFLTEYARRFGRLPPHTRERWQTSDAILEAAGIRGNRSLSAFS